MQMQSIRHNFPKSIIVGYYICNCVEFDALRQCVVTITLQQTLTPVSSRQNNNKNAYKQEFENASLLRLSVEKKIKFYLANASFK